MIDTVIIITTALSRIDMHNITFPHYKSFIGQDYRVKWYINIDTLSYCTDDDIATELNLIKHVKDYDYTIIKSSKPNFFVAVKTLLNLASDHISDTSCILWLEDDWMVRTDKNLKYYVDKFLCPMSYISLVYNNLGSFPPFIMGPKLAQMFVPIFCKMNKPTVDPELISRRILRQFCFQFGLVYYTYTDNASKLPKECLVQNGMIYQEAYLQSDNNRILCDNISDHPVLPTDDLQTYHELYSTHSQSIIFVRFGIRPDHVKYRSSCFADLGRPWKIKKLTTT